MNETQIAERLVAIHTALVDKIGTQPWVPPSLSIGQDAVLKISFYRDWNKGDYYLGKVMAKTFAEVFEGAESFIAALPSPEIAKKKSAMSAYGKAVDGLRDAGFDDDIIKPASATLQAISKNLLTYEAAK